MAAIKKLSYKEMTMGAIGSLNERNGSSIQAILKYIVHAYGIDIAKCKIHMKRYLKKAVSNGELIQTKGTGFTGSFKLAKVTIKQKSKKEIIITDNQPSDGQSDKKAKPKKAAKGKLGPKISANIKIKGKKTKDEIPKTSDEKKAAKKVKDSEKTGKNAAKKYRKDLNSKSSKIVLKRASLIGGTKIHKPLKKTMSKPKQQKQIVPSTE